MEGVASLVCSQVKRPRVTRWHCCMSASPLVKDVQYHGNATRVFRAHAWGWAEEPGGPLPVDDWATCFREKTRRQVACILPSPRCHNFDIVISIVGRACIYSYLITVLLIVCPEMSLVRCNDKSARGSYYSRRFHPKKEYNSRIQEFSANTTTPIFLTS